MPGLNGIDLAEKLMAIKNIPIILYTGQGSEEVAQRAFHIGVHDYIRKEIEPTHYEVLLNSIKQSVKKHRAEQIYRVVFESNPDSIIVVHDNIIKYSNKSASQLLEVSSESCLNGRNFLEHIQNVDQDELTWMSLQRVISENSVIPFEFDVRADNGAVKRVMGSLQNMLFMGTPSQVYFLRDVSSIRRVESALLHASHRFDKLFELSSLGLAFSTIDGKVTKHNRAFTDILGLDDDCSGFNLLSDPELYIKIRSNMFQNDSINHELECEFSELRDGGLLNSTKNGLLNVNMVISPVLQEDSEPLYLVQIQSLPNQFT
jgi:PAS domain S-box-containing protein